MASQARQGKLIRTHANDDETDQDRDKTHETDA